MTATVRDATPSRPALFGVFGGLLCSYAGLSAAIPALPPYLRASFHAQDAAVGLAVTATAWTALLVRPVAGLLADRHGCRLVMLIGALIVSASGFLYLVPSGIRGLIGLRLTVGVGEAALFTAGAVWTMSLATHERRGQLIGLYGVSMWGGISAGTLIGARLLEHGHAAVWIFCGAAPLVGCLFIGAAPAMPAAGGGRAAPGLALGPALLPGIGLAFASAGYAVLAAFVILDLRRRGIDSGVLVLGLFSACYAGTRLVIGHLPDRLGAARVAVWAACGEAAGLVAIALAPDLAAALLGSMVMGVGFSLLNPSLALLVMDRCSVAQRGAALGTYTSFWDLGLAVSGPALGAVAGALGFTAAFGVAAGCALMAAGVGLAAPHLMRPAHGHG